MKSVLIAGVGNVFLGDDGFGVEVARRLSGLALPDWVRVADFGIRGLHLAYELLDRDDDLTVLVDALPRGGHPGTVYLMEPDLDSCRGGCEGHSMHPEAVLSTLVALGGAPRRVLVVGCEPLSLDESMELSAPVSDAVEEAVRLVRELIDKEARDVPGNSR